MSVKSKLVEDVLRPNTTNNHHRLKLKEKTLLDATSQAAGSTTLSLVDLGNLDMETATIAARASSGNITITGKYSINADGDFKYPSTAFDIISTVTGTTNPKGRIKDGGADDWGAYLEVVVTTTGTADIEVYLVGQNR